MTINVRLRKGSVTVVTESLVTTVMEEREEGETVNVDVYPGARVAVLEDGATAQEMKDILTSE